MAVVKCPVGILTDRLDDVCNFAIEAMVATRTISSRQKTVTRHAEVPVEVSCSLENLCFFLSFSLSLIVYSSHYVMIIGKKEKIESLRRKLQFSLFSVKGG